VCAYARDLSVAFAFALALRSLGDSDSLPPTNSPNTTTPASRSVVSCLCIASVLEYMRIKAYGLSLEIVFSA